MAIGTRRDTGRRPASAPARPGGANPLRLPGLLLGVGLGGFVDGIVLHQLLQWHHMLSSAGTDRLGLHPVPATTVAGLEINTFWDGLFHVFSWVAVVAGVAVLYSRVSTGRGRVWASRALWGWVVAGWGLFDLVEGLVDHQILGIHHVRSGPHELWWDLGYLAFGAALLVGGWLLQRSARQSSA